MTNAVNTVVQFTDLKCQISSVFQVCLLYLFPWQPAQGLKSNQGLSFVFLSRYACLITVFFFLWKVRLCQKRTFSQETTISLYYQGTYLNNLETFMQQGGSFLGVKGGDCLFDPIRQDCSLLGSFYCPSGMWEESKGCRNVVSSSGKTGQLQVIIIALIWFTWLGAHQTPMPEPDHSQLLQAPQRRRRWGIPLSIRLQSWRLQKTEKTLSSVCFVLIVNQFLFKKINVPYFGLGIFLLILLFVCFTFDASRSYFRAFQQSSLYFLL